MTYQIPPEKDGGDGKDPAEKNYFWSHFFLSGDVLLCVPILKK